MKVRRPTASEMERLRILADYQFGYPAGDILITDEVMVAVSPGTGRIREIYGYEGLLAVLRAHDYFYSLSLKGARRLLALPFPRLRAVVKSGVVVGKSVSCRAVSMIDSELYAGEEVIVVDRELRLLGVGRLRLAPEEIMEPTCHGEAIRLRKLSDEVKEENDA